MATKVIDPNKPVEENMAIKPAVVQSVSMPKTLDAAQKIAPSGVTVTQTATKPNILTATGGYNPRTGGFETVNTDTQVNTGKYSIQEKAALAKSKGLSGSISQDAFYRDPMGTLSIKDEYLNTGVKPATPEKTQPAPYTGITTTSITDEDTQAKSVLDNIYASNNMTQEQKDWWNTNVFNNPEERKKFLEMTDPERKEYMSNVNQANILTRDANLKAEYAKTEYERKMADAKAQAALNTEKAKMELDAQANNFSIAQGTYGRLKSRNMVTAIQSQLDIGRKTYEEMIATNDRYIQALADEYKYNNTVASNEYNDAMARIKQDLFNKIESLKKTGAMQTQSGLLQARSFLDMATAAGDGAMQRYSYNLGVAQERVKAMADQMREQNKFSKEMTEASNSPYLLNAQGGVMTDSQGQPLMRDQTKKIADTIMDNMGNVTILYADGTFSTPKMGIGKKEIEKPIFVDTVGGKQQFVFDPESGTYKPTGQVIAAPIEQMTPYQRAQIDLERAKLAGTGSSATIISTSPESVAQFSIDKRGRANLQCGELTNDYWQQMTGKPLSTAPSINTYQGKIDAIKSVGLSEGPVVGGLFAMKTGAKAGHIGIVQSVNEDGSITVLEANRAGTAEGGTPELATYKNTSGMTFSVAPDTSALGLSKQAKNIWETGASIPTGKEGNEIRKELAESGLYDEGIGNERFVTAKMPEKQDLLGIIRAKEAADNIQRLYDGLKAEGVNPVGPIDSWFASVGNLMGIGVSQDYNTLKNLTTKELNSYINQITGAAVSPSEAVRLKSVVPTIDSTESTFEANLEQFRNQVNSSLEMALGNYGFSDIEKAKQRLGVKETAGSTQQDGVRAEQQKKDITSIKKNYLKY